MNVHPRATELDQSIRHGMIADESELTAGVKIEPGKQYGFFTDTTLCIGCKACEVACKEWNALPADDLKITGMSYDNTASFRPILGGTSPSSRKCARTATMQPSCRPSRVIG